MDKGETERSWFHQGGARPDGSELLQILRFVKASSGGEWFPVHGAEQRRFLDEAEHLGKV